MTTDDPVNPWTPEDEGDHSPVMKEWWTTDLFFKTLEDNRTWNLMMSLAYEQETPSCFFQYVLFDMLSKKCVRHKDVNDDIQKFSHAKNRLDLRYEKSTFQGLYPKYHLHIEDEPQGFVADVEYTAQSLPHWIVQETTQGTLPIGLNFYRYGFLPHFDIKGTMKFQGSLYTITGKGYLEHAWGNWSYQHPLQMLAGFRKTIATYARLSKWWLSHHPVKIPRRIGFMTENNMFGYDWIWGVCDNNWSVFYGNSLLWVSEGPSFGALYVTPDGKQYWEFGNVRFKYNKLLYVKDYDIYYPAEMELSGRLGEKTIHLRFWSTTESYVYSDPFKKGRFYKAFVLGELPGRMEGTYTDNEKTVPLNGNCKLVPLRQAPMLGHTAVSLSFLLPPQGVGLSVDIDSHRLRKKLCTSIQLAPHPALHWKLTPIDLSHISRESKEP
jgi:hypothetical protein